MLHYYLRRIECIEKNIPPNDLGENSVDNENGE